MDLERLETLLTEMHRAGGSALHLAPGRPPGLRVQRRLVPAGTDPLAPDAVDELLRDMLFADHRQQLADKGHVEVLCVARTGRRYRTTVTALDGAHALVLRPVPATPPRLDELGLPPAVGAFAQAHGGLVLVAGFFGSGRSTTLAAIVDALNRDPARHVVTIEPTIEYLHPPGAALLHQREVGVHVGSTADGVRQALALGVDTIVATEIGDAASLDAAVAAAESGCLVFGGVAAGSVVGALAELTQTVPAELRGRLRLRLARALRGAVAQSLLQRSKAPGQVPLVEVLVANGPVRQAIRTGDFHELPAIMQRCRGLGMQTAELALQGLLAQQLVSREDALLHAGGPAPSQA
ncbi:MAG: type IV pili twitching motility protein PilT [Planctomycetes bacterium]|nr:type IV pili twitching motility protein PilT [Planctomycetota bacterium]